MGVVYIVQDSRGRGLVMASSVGIAEGNAIKRPRLSGLEDGYPTETNEMAALPNPHLSSLDKDFLYHIGYYGHECKELFKDVKVSVCG